jgi:hypothetical protein
VRGLGRTDQDFCGGRYMNCMDSKSLFQRLKIFICPNYQYVNHHIGHMTMLLSTRHRHCNQRPVFYRYTPCRFDYIATQTTTASHRPCAKRVLYRTYATMLHPSCLFERAMGVHRTSLILPLMQGKERLDVVSPCYCKLQGTISRSVPRMGYTICTTMVTTQPLLTKVNANMS